MNANSAKKPTSSTSGPTATTSAKIVGKTVSINDGEDVIVSEESNENYHTYSPDFIDDAVFKCAGCALLTIHQGYQFDIFPVEDKQGTNPGSSKRVYLCTNCGRFSTK